MVTWRIYYADGTTFDSNDGVPDVAQPWGVQAVVCALEDPANPSTYFGEDYYWWDPDGWRGGDFIGLIDYLARPGWKRVLFGRLVDNATFATIRDRAFHDQDFGVPR